MSSTRGRSTRGRRGGGAVPAVDASEVNLIASPDVSVTTDAGAFPAVARIAKTSERSRLWRTISYANPRLDEMARTKGREFPIVVLDRSAEPGRRGADR